MFQEGICVWARDSGRTGCGLYPDEEPEKKKRRKKPKPPSNISDQKPKKREKLSNGFSCPGGKLGVHIALPHPSNCRSYYVCLNGVDPSEQGCSNGKVFNPSTSACDAPNNVPGCENYYNKAPKVKKQPKAVKLLKEEPRSSDIPGGDIRGFLQILKANGLLKPGALETLEQSTITEDKSISKLIGQSRTPVSRKKQSEQSLDDSFETPRESRRKSIFERKIPPKRRNKFTNIIPKIKPVGNLENIHPIGLMENDFENEISEEKINDDQTHDDMTSKLKQLSPDIEKSDNEMLKTIVKAILDDDPQTKSTKIAPVIKETPSRLRRLRRPGASSLFNTDKRKASSIFNRTRTRLRGSLHSTTSEKTTTSTTTEQSIPDEEENLIETSLEDQRPRLQSFRNRFRPKLRLRQRPRLPFRPNSSEKHHKDDDEDEIESMMKTLEMESMLKKEFDKFLENKLSHKRPRFRPTGTGLRDRAKLRNSILRSRFRTTTPNEDAETTTIDQELKAIDATSESSTTSSTSTTTTDIRSSSCTSTISCCSSSYKSNPTSNV